MTTDTKRESYLEFLRNAATADKETDIDGLFGIFEPEGKTRAQMGEVFEDALGYNPITHFDVEELSGIMNTILEEAEPAFITAVKPQRKRLISRAMEIFDNIDRSDTLKVCLAKASKDILSEDLSRMLCESLLGYDLPGDDDDSSTNDFEGLEDDVDSIADTMQDMEDESGLGPSDLDDDELFEFDDEEE